MIDVRRFASEWLPELKIWFIRHLYFGYSARMEHYEFYERAVAAKSTPLQIVHRQWLDADKDNHPMRHIYRAITNARDKRFSDALQPYIPDADYQYIAAGETKGDIQAGFTNAIQAAKENRELRGLITKPLIYPVLLMLLYIGGLIVLSLADIWTVIELEFDRYLWPQTTEDLANFSTFLAEYLIPILIVSAVSIATILYLLPRWKGPLREKFDERIPIFVQYRFFYSIVFLKTIALMLTSKTQGFRSILNSIHESANPWYRYYLTQINDALTAGAPEAMALDITLLDRRQVKYLKFVAVDAERFPLALSALSERALDNAKARFAVTARIVNIVMITIIALSLIWVMTAMFDLGMAFVEELEAQELPTV